MPRDVPHHLHMQSPMSSLDVPSVAVRLIRVVVPEGQFLIATPPGSLVPTGPPGAH
jgi:hypothetical protein